MNEIKYITLNPRMNYYIEINKAGCLMVSLRIKPQKLFLHCFNNDRVIIYRERNHAGILLKGIRATTRVPAASQE